jgi:tetratricopeptide (TPR) repeat protein
MRSCGNGGKSGTFGTRVTPKMQWRTRPLFVSSTFNDFQVERDVLQTLVFPTLAERLRERRHDLEPIDLRLGVETASEADEVRKTLLVLGVCLREVERSRPFLIVMVGDCYGWVPPPERARRAAAESGLDVDVSGKSVTHLEVEAGVLRPPSGGPVRTFAYFRELDLDSVPEHLRSRYGDADRGAVSALKEHLRGALGPQRCRDYPAVWDAARGGIGGLDEFRRIVLDDVWSDLDAETRRHLVVVESWQDHQRAALEAFVHDTARDFTGREALLDELSSLARSDTSRLGACVVGPPGSGKSSVAAELIRLLQADPSLVLLAHAAGIEGESVQIDRVLQRWCGELAEKLGDEDPPGDDVTGEQLEHAFARLLTRAASRWRTVIVIDALNELERTPRGRRLTWLPPLWPPNAALIATATPGPEIDALQQRAGFYVVELEPLTESEASHIADAVYRRYRRQANPDVRRALLDKRTEDGQAAAGNPLWLELACEEMNLLDPEELARATGFEGTPDLQLVLVQRELVLQLPATAQAMYSRMLTRAEAVAASIVREELLSPDDDAARAWVQCLSELIAISRNGWREGDLQSLLAQLTGVPWSELLFASVRRAYRGHLIQRGSSGLWSFYHQELRHGVRRHFGSSSEYLVRVHAAAASYLATLPADNPLRRTERMHHLIGADHRAGAAILYAESEHGSEELRAQTESLADLFRTRDDALDWVGSLLDDARLSPPQELLLGEKLMYPLHDALAAEGRVEERRALLALVREHIARRAGGVPPGPKRDLVLRQHAVSLLRLADLAFDGGDVAVAQELYEAYARQAEEAEATALDRRMGGLDLCVAFERLGTLAERRGDVEQARASFQRQLDVASTLVGSWPDDLESLRQVASALERLGKVALSEGDDVASARLAEAAQVHDRIALVSGAGVASSALEIRARLAEARDELDEARDLLERHEALLHERALAAPEDVEAQVAWANSLEQLGDVALAAGDPDAARRSFLHARELAARLASQLPDDVGVRRNWSTALEKVGDVALQEADFAHARQCYEQSLRIREDLHAALPGDVQARRDVGLAHERLGQVKDQPPETRVDHLERAVVIFADLYADLPGNEEAGRTLALGHFALSEALAEIPERGIEAHEHGGRAHELLSDLRASGRRLEPKATHLLAFLDTHFGSSGRWTHPVSPDHQAADDELNMRGMLGAEALAAGKYRKAKRSFRRSLELAREIDHPPSIVRACGSLGELHANTGDVAAALELLNEAIAIARANDLPVEEGQTLMRLGDLYSSAGDRDAALRVYEERVDLATRADDRRGWALGSAKLGVLHFERRQYVKAVEYLEAAGRAFEANLMHSDLALTCSYLGAAYQSVGDAAGATRAYRRHIELSRQMGDPAAAAGSMVNLSGLLFSAGEREEAISLREEASHYLTGPQVDSQRRRWQVWKRH